MKYWNTICLALLAFLAAFVPVVHSGPDGFRIAPYLLDVTTQGATVAFHLHDPLPARVLVHTPDKVLSFASPAARSHYVKVTGLTPQRAFRYEVDCGEGRVATPPQDPTYQIRTACLAGESFLFSVYGDPRPGDSGTDRTHREIIRQIQLHEPAFSLILGDMVDNGDDPTQWEAFFDVESPLLRQTPAYPVMGDNDYASDGKSAATYFPMLEKSYYRFEWGGSQFLGLRAWDSRGGQNAAELDANSPQVKWLEQELAKPEVQNAPFRVVFCHDPVTISRGRSAEVLKRVWAPLFEKYKVDVVFASWHIYERTHKNGVVYVISGGAGAEIIWMNKNPAVNSQAEAKRHHFCRVDVNESFLSIRAVATDGTVLDEITLTPRAQDPGRAAALERAARRMAKPLVFNQGPGRPAMDLHLFSYDCPFCKRLQKKILPELAQKHGVALNVQFYDLGLEGAYDLFLNAGAQFGRQDSDLPAVFAGRAVLGGEGEITRELTAQVEQFANNPQAYRAQSLEPFSQAHDTKTMGEAAFDALTMGIVVGAGLLDGINPCAFATIVFLISYLSLFGVSTRRAALIGAFFTLAVFFTYFSIGLLFHHTLRTLLVNPGLSLAINGALLVLVLVLGTLSVRDFYRAATGRAAEITLKLPDFLSKGIQKRIADFASNKVAMIGAPIVLGVVVSGMELACTGQVYVPIVTMISEPARRASALMYLVIYNLAFITPLVIVYGLALLGHASGRAAKSPRYLTAVKAGHVIFFFTMALVLLYNLNLL